MKKKSLTWSLLFVFQIAFAQDNPVLDNFTLAEDKGTVFLHWTIASGSICNGIQIYRSIEEEPFIEIGSIAGICGASSTSTSYNFTDINPVKNSINSYRLELGGNGYSEVLSLELIDINSGGYQIRPNPLSTNAKIYFDNNKKAEHQFLLYNIGGLILTTITSKEDFFDLDASNLLSGLYFFSIRNENSNEKAKGKILIQH